MRKMVEIKSSWSTRDNRKSFSLEEKCIYCDGDRDLERYHVHLRDPQVDTIGFYVCTGCRNDYNFIKEMRGNATRLLRSTICGREYKPFVPHWASLRI